MGIWVFKKKRQLKKRKKNSNALLFRCLDLLLFKLRVSLFLHRGRVDQQHRLRRLGAHGRALERRDLRGGQAAPDGRGQGLRREAAAPLLVAVAAAAAGSGGD